jgi:hypothetical protein
VGVERDAGTDPRPVTVRRQSRSGHGGADAHDVESDEGYARAVCAYAAQQLEYGVCEEEVLAMLRELVGNLDRTPPPDDAATRWPEEPQRETGAQHIVTGALWCVAGLGAVTMMYGAVAPAGTYVLAGGAFTFGALKVVRGITER